jgi:hypothetical protein
LLPGLELIAFDRRSTGDFGYAGPALLHGLLTPVNSETARLRPRVSFSRAQPKDCAIFGTHPGHIRIGGSDDPKKVGRLQALRDAGGGTRTPDTRIMIPLL